MKLVERKCPNCGAGLSFKEEDTVVKCNYCKQTFDIKNNDELEKVVTDFVISNFKQMSIISKIFPTFLL